MQPAGLVSELGERVAVEHGQEGGQRLIQRRGERAGGGDGALVVLRIEALDQVQVVLRRAHDLADVDLGGRPRQLHAAEAAAERRDEAELGQAGDHLRRVVLGHSHATGDVRDA